MLRSLATQLGKRGIHLIDAAHLVGLSRHIGQAGHRQPRIEQLVTVPAMTARHGLDERVLVGHRLIIALDDGQ